MIKLLSCKDEIGNEVRPLYFYKAFKKEIPEGRIISFGSCNFNCSYCKRRGSHRSSDGSIIFSVNVAKEKLFSICDDAISKNQIIRLSGGDPVMFPGLSLEIAKYIKDNNGRLSMAHNGSSPVFVSKMAIFLESAAIDLKSTPEYMSTVIGLSPEIAKEMYYRSLMTQKVLLDRGVLVDIRTPIFHFTTLDDLLLMLSDININSDSSNKFWTLRLYQEIMDCKLNSPDKDNVLWMVSQLKKKCPSLKFGIRSQWESKEFVYL